MTLHSQSGHDAALAIAGTGRMASALGALLSRCGIPILAVAGRSPHSTAEAVRFTGAARAVTFAELPAIASRILIAVSDDALPAVSSELAAAGLGGALVLHTCGAAGPAALAPLRAAANSTGVLHPLQTVPSAEAGLLSLPGSTFAYAGDSAAAGWARQLIHLLGGEPLPVDATRWPLYHAAAVMACNYHAVLVDAALDLMESAGIGRGPALHALAPLIRAATANILCAGPAQALTGPIRRGDAGTVASHMAALASSSPEIMHLYAVAGLRAVALATRAGLSAPAAARIQAALEPPPLP
ncbi:MAG: DUF2520 domain-containing protein [Candidatus Solibacter usitatus]|nr:DUF2520 domain-containing protein [Candidatus Solibacter usitatus]